MKKLFISQPMRDKTNEEIKEERVKAIKEVESHLGEKVEVLDSFFEGAPHEANPLWFLSKSIGLLSQADIAYFCKGWEDYRGCRIENTCAIAYNIEVLNCEINHPRYEDTITESAEKSYINGYVRGVENTAKEYKLKLDLHLQESILDKVKAEIMDCLGALHKIEESGINIYLPNEISGRRLTYEQCIEIIDKYIMESKELSNSRFITDSSISSSSSFSGTNS